MFFSESERLQRRFPQLEGLIRQLDRLVETARARGRLCVTASYVAGRIGCDGSDARAVLDAFVDEGVLRRVFSPICPKTKATVHEYDDPSLIGPSYFCDLCVEDHEQSDSKTAVLYVGDRLRPEECRPFDHGGVKIG